ncbi:MAG: hypothetical protein ABI724_12475 [Betaproteobacteria bacterium]
MSPDASSKSDTTAPHSAVDPQNPWLGLASFTEETRGYFYGREEEIAELSRRVQRKLLTILFGQSGLGKTSILRAGIVPRLRPEGYCPVYVRLDYSPEAPEPSEQIKQAIFRATEASGHWTQTGSAVAGESLWEFLHHRDDVLLDAAGKTIIPLLIFDQFEEIFTLAQSDDFGRKRASQFLDDLADLVENRAPKALEARIDTDETVAERFDFTRGDYRILIALREDYLAHLEGVKGIMPSITQNRMRLARMTGAQALAAVVKPGGKLVSEEVAGSIVRFIAGGSELPNAEVEPSLLSLICRELNTARIAQGRSEISADLLAGSRETILSEFYERALADQPAGVRTFIEDAMLTDSGFRESLAEERVQKAFAAVGAPTDTLSKLVDRRLLRIEERLDVRRVELTHDVLCGVVKASRDLRLEREARDEAERKLAAQRERERATRKALVRARQIAIGCAVLAVFSVGAALFGYLSMKRAQEAEAKADQTRQMAEAARGEAEKLIVYLLDDFNLELAPVGRLDIVGELAKRALDYYSKLPEALRTPQTERNRALALVRYGTVLRTLARLPESNKAIDEAVAVLGKMRDQGDLTETTAIGLAMGLSTQARLASSVNDESGGLTKSNKAVEILKPLATAQFASIPVRRAYGEVLNMHGFLQLRNDRDEKAIATLEEARTVYRGIDDLRMTDLPSAAGYAEATSWQVQAYAQQARFDDAMRAGKEAIDMTTKVLEKRPGHMQALRALALTTSPLSGMLSDAMQPEQALAMSDSTIRTWQEFVRMDPGNAISWSNLSVGFLIRAAIQQTMGRPSDAAATHRAALQLDAGAPPNLLLKSGLSLHAGRLAQLEASRGNLRQSEEALAIQDKHRTWVIDNAPAGGWDKMSRPLYGVYWRAITATASGEHRRGLDIGRALVPRLEALKPPDASARRELDFVLVWLHNDLAESAFALGDYSEAAREAILAVEIRGRMIGKDLGQQRDEAFEQAVAAVTLARANRQADAQKLAAQALKFERGLGTRNRGDPSQRFELAVALYAAAMAGPGNPAALLSESNALMDKLPAEMLTLSNVAAWRNRVAEDQKKRR